MAVVTIIDRTPAVTVSESGKVLRVDLNVPVVRNHAALTNRSDAGAHPALAISFTPPPGLTQDNVQDALAYALALAAAGGGGGGVADHGLLLGLGDDDHPHYLNQARGDLRYVQLTDGRLTDARAPLAHAASHATGQPDAISPASIGAAAAGHSHAFADITGKPTTLVGYGITDAATDAELAAAIASVTTASIGAIPTSEKGAANGVATLDAGGKVPITQIPDAARPAVHLPADATARAALTVQEGDEAIQLDDGSHWIFDGTIWRQRPSGGGGSVSSVFGRTGAVVAQAGDYTAAQVGAIPTTEKGAASGVATLGADGLLPAGQTPAAVTTHLGSTSNPHAVTAAQVGAVALGSHAATSIVGRAGGTGGDAADIAAAADDRLLARTGGSLGFVQLGLGMIPDALITGAKLAAALSDPIGATAGLRTLGTGAQQACAGNDARLSDARTPTGAAGGQLGGTFPSSLDVRGIRETSGPTLLTLGAVADGEYLRRVGSTVVGGTPSGGGGSWPFGAVPYVRAPGSSIYATASNLLGAATKATMVCVAREVVTQWYTNTLFGNYNGTDGVSWAKNRWGDQPWQNVEYVNSVIQDNRHTPTAVGNWNLYVITYDGDANAGADAVCWFWMNGTRVRRYESGQGGVLAGGNIAMGGRPGGSETCLDIDFHALAIEPALLSDAAILAMYESLKTNGVLPNITGTWEAAWIAPGTDPGGTWAATYGTGNLTRSGGAWTAGTDSTPVWE